MPIETVIKISKTFMTVDRRLITTSNRLYSLKKNIGKRCIAILNES